MAPHLKDHADATTPPVRVLHLCSTSDLGGAERMVLNLASALPREEFEVHIGALIGSGALMDAARQQGTPAIHFQFRNSTDFSGIRRLIRYCRENHIQIVQTHGLRADAIARWAARIGGACAVISTIHSIDPWRRTPHVILDRLTAPWVTHYIAVCDAAAQAAIRREKIQPSRCSIVHIGVPHRDIPRQHRDQIRAKLGLTDDDYPVVGILANLREMKGHHHVIAALPGILEINPTARFIFAGRDDSNGTIIQAARDAGVEHSILAIGFHNNPPELFAAMDIFMLPSDWEGFPVSILEAMQAGVPVIATNVGGIPEMIRDQQDGLLIPPGNPEAITAAVNLLARDFSYRAALVRSADARYQAEFTLNAMADKMSHIYHQIVEKTCPSPQ